MISILSRSNEVLSLVDSDFRQNRVLEEIGSHITMISRRRVTGKAENEHIVNNRTDFRKKLNNDTEGNLVFKDFLTDNFSRINMKLAVSREKF